MQGRGTPRPYNNYLFFWVIALGNSSVLRGQDSPNI